MEALRILETYKMALHMYSANSSSSDLAPHELVIRNFYDLPSKQIAHFVGRHETFRELTRCLEEGATPKTHDRKIAVLIGMSGQGKTQIALEYCRRAQASRAFRFIIWIDASSESSLIRSYGNVVEKLTGSRITFPGDKDRASYLINCFLRSCANWLLVFDNFDKPDVFQNIKDYLPPGNSGACLFISQSAQSGRLGTCIAVTKMTEDESVELLLQQAKKDATQENISLAKAIAKKLGYYPLALDQAGSYLASRRLPLESFLEHYTSRKDMILKYSPTLWEYQKRLNQNENETSITTFTTWEMSLEQIEDDRDRLAVLHFLTLAAFLDSTNLGDSLFRNYVVLLPQLPVWTSCLVTGGRWDGCRFQDLVALLHTMSLINGVDFRSPEARFSLHPLIKDWLRLRTPQTEGFIFAREAIRLVTASIEAIPNKEMVGEVGRVLVSQIDACMANEKEIFQGNFGMGLLSLEDSALSFASTYIAHTLFENARSLYASLLDYQKRVNSPHALETAMNLANVLRIQGKHKQAEKLYVKVFEERTRLLGARHVDTLRALEGLAIIHSLQANFPVADKEFQQILQDRENDSGSDSPGIASECLAIVRRYQSRHGEAEALYARALNIHIQVSGPQSFDALRCVQGLAAVYIQQGRLEEAIRLYQQALKHLESMLGSSHPAVLHAALSVSIAYIGQKRYAEAESIGQRALQGLERVLGSEHVDTKRAAAHLAAIQNLNPQNSNRVPM